MKKFFPFFTSKYLFAFFLILGIVLRFNNLNWGAPYYFHPDERQNIAYPILESQSIMLHDQKNFDINPFPLILIKASFEGTKLFLQNTSFGNVAVILIISRTISALFSVGISLLIFIIGTKYISKLVGYLGFYLSMLSVGLIQYAHFGTIEILEAFLFLLVVFLLLATLKNRSYKLLISIGFVFSLAVATKFLSFFLLPSVVIAFLIVPFFQKKKLSQKLAIFTRSLSLFLLGFIAGTLVFFPKFLLSPQVFEHSLQFESEVALGTLPVFYTQGFYNTIPILFQLKNIFPFFLNPLLAILVPFAIGWSLWNSFSRKDVAIFIILISFLSLFTGQAMLFVKWARYMIPSLPFLYILISYTIVAFTQLLKLSKKATDRILLTFVVLSSFFALAYVVEVFGKTNTVLEARNFAAKKIHSNSSFVAEPYDVGAVPFLEHFPDVNFFNFYELDEQKNEKELEMILNRSDYVLLTSQRLLRSRINNKERFPLGNRFYENLLYERGFEKIYQTSCDLLCKLVYLNDPIFQFEETVSVFDRPTVTIFKKK